MILKDERIAGDIRYVMTSNPREIMQVPDEIRKCTVFVGHRTKSGEKVARGTGFFVAKPLVRGKLHAIYCVTAHHVIDKMKTAGHYEVSLRMNMASGKSEWIDTPLQDWVFHHDDANVDVAVFRFVCPWDEKAHDHLAWPIWLTLDQHRIQMEEIGIGDEVFFPGLFSKHMGEERNIPIVRIGNIAAMPEEKLISKTYCVDAYLVEARSFGGLSGSPVFVHPGLVRIIEGKPMRYRGTTYYLMGLVHGHFETRAVCDEVAEDFSLDDDSLNMGIAIVVPVAKIIEVLNHPKLAKLDEIDTKKWEDEHAPTLDDQSDREIIESLIRTRLMLQQDQSRPQPPRS